MANSPNSSASKKAMQMTRPYDDNSEIGCACTNNKINVTEMVGLSKVMRVLTPQENMARLAVKPNCP